MHTGRWLACLFMIILLVTCVIGATPVVTEMVAPGDTAPPSPTATDTRSPTVTNTQAPTATPTPVLTGHIVFLSRRDGNLEIYIMDPDGTHQTRLTNTGENELFPVGSPDGTFIAFSADYEGDEEIYRIQSDGSGLTRLTTSPRTDFNPEWSPDGNWLLFSSAKNIIEGYEGPPLEIYTMDKNGGGQRRLTNNTTSDYCASWSPDMSQITFSSYRYDFDFVRIEIMDSDGTDSRTLVEVPENAFCPKWSPDGQQIVFYSLSDRQEYGGVWLMSADGTNIQELPFFDVTAKFDGVRWSPDGQWLVFAADIGSGYDVYRATLDGQVVNLTPQSSALEESPSWIP